MFVRSVCVNNQVIFLCEVFENCIVKTKCEIFLQIVVCEVFVRSVCVNNQVIFLCEVFEICLVKTKCEKYCVRMFCKDVLPVSPSVEPQPVPANPKLRYVEASRAAKVCGRVCVRVWCAFLDIQK